MQRVEICGISISQSIFYDSIKKIQYPPIQDLVTSKGFFSKFPLSSRVFFTWELYPLHMSSNFPPQKQPQTPWGILTCQMSGICLEGILLFYHNLIVTLCHIISHRLTLQSSFCKIQKWGELQCLKEELSSRRKVLNTYNVMQFILLQF